MEPVRRAALIAAAIEEIGAAGNLSVTVARIARRAGVSPALAHHYFGSKDQLFLAAMRQILTDYGAAVRSRLRGAADPRARLDAIIAGSFEAHNFDAATVAAWLNFYVLARSDPEARRLLAVYHRRLHSNLTHALRPLAGARAEAIAERIAALIDGIYLRAALGRQAPGDDPAAAVRAALDDALRR